MEIVRHWDGNTFTYYALYRNGTVSPTTRREAEQYKRLGKVVRTVLEKPRGTLLGA